MTATKEELLALAERVEGLDGPDREIMDAAFDACLPRRTDIAREGVIAWTREWLRFRILTNAEAWLEAALMLVPDGANWAVDYDGAMFFANVTRKRADGTLVHGEHGGCYATTLALALTAAALRAQAELVV